MEQEQGDYGSVRVDREALRGMPVDDALDMAEAMGVSLAVMLR